MKSMFALRPLLWLDAVTCIAFGLLIAIAAGPLSELLGLPVPLLREAGILLFPFALFVLWVAMRTDPARGTRAIIAANVAWVLASLALLAGPWVEPTAIGTAFVAVQAAAVAGIAILEAHALRRPLSTA